MHCFFYQTRHTCTCNGQGINVKYAGFKLSFANISMVNIKLRTLHQWVQLILKVKLWEVQNKQNF